MQTSIRRDEHQQRSLRLLRQIKRISAIIKFISILGCLGCTPPTRIRLAFAVDANVPGVGWIATLHNPTRFTQLEAALAHVAVMSPEYNARQVVKTKSTIESCGGITAAPIGVRLGKAGVRMLCHF